MTHPSIRFLVSLVLAGTTALATASASAEPVKCERAIAKESAKLAALRAGALAKCEEQRLKGKVTTTCPDAATAAKLTKAASGLHAKIAKACGGKDKICGADATGEDTPTAVGWPLTCPGIAGGSCVGAIDDCEGIAGCLECVDAAAVDQVIALAYHAALPVAPKSPTQKCQLAIGKSTAKFLQDKSKALLKCWDTRLAKKHANDCPSPGDGKAAGAIAKAAAKRQAAICKACGGPDKACGGGDDLTPADVGFAPTCPAVHVPGGADCGAIGAIGDLADLTACLECVTEQKVDCVDRLQVPVVATYPSECNPVVPAATPTTTATFTPGGGQPTPTATATPTVTATPGGLTGCPSQLQLDGDQTTLDLDMGWHGGTFHDLANSPLWHRVSFAVSGCGSANPPCGQCNLSGPITNVGTAGLNNHRCVGDTSLTCVFDGDCGASGPCHFFLGPPVPFGRGLPGCFVADVTGAASGTTNVEAGSVDLSMPARLRTYLPENGEDPCPKCVGGLCSGGQRSGLACTVTASSIAFGDALSFDCPPINAVNSQSIALALSTTTQTRTLSAASPNCRAFGFTGQKCLCDTCATAAGEPCFTSADCPGGAACNGSMVGGAETQPNSCAPADGAPDGCQTAGGAEGQCADGPFDVHCASPEDWRTCSVPQQATDCPLTGSCVFTARECYADNGVLGGSVSATGIANPPVAGVFHPTLGALFCLRPASSFAINAGIGLPGPGRLSVPMTATYLSSQ